MARPLRILRILTRLNIGGPALHAALLSTKLDPARFSTCLVVGEVEASEGDLSELVQGSPVKTIRIRTLRRALRPWSDLAAFLQLLRVVWQERPHIIHTHMAKAGALGRFAGVCYNRLGPGRRREARAILVHTFHGHVLDEYFSAWLSGFFVRIERWLARWTHCLIAVSETVRNELLQKGIGCREQWRVIPLGLDLSALGQLPFPNGTSVVRLGMVGRLVPIKNPGLLLQAFHRFMSQPIREEAETVIVGDGPLRLALEREAQQLGLEGRVRFTGWQRDLRSVYGGIDIACLTSWNEGTPVALIEAMAAGRAVVATDVGGVRDLLDDAGARSAPIPTGRFHIARRGILVRAGDAEGLAAALEVLAADVTLRKRLAEAARPHVLRAFAQERLLQDMSALYDELVRGSER